MDAQPAVAAVSRKIVTIVFADLIGSVSLHERLDAESARRLMDRYHRAMSAAVDVHGGRVVQLLGDGVLAAFGVPRVAEDDAIRAVRAAVGMQRAFRELAREQGAAMEGVGLRVAVNTGEIVVSDDANSVMGDPTNVAARLQQEARDGDVIVGEGTQRLVRDLVTLAPLGTFALRGRAEAVAAYRVVSLDRPASQQAIAFVGRDDELRRLVAVYDTAVATPSARLAVLLGSPGLGKSRLVSEFTRRAAERATVLSARCDAAGGATFAPLAGALRALLRIDEGAGGDVLRAAIDAVVPGDDAERTRIATGIDALLAGTPAPPEETFFVVRRLLAALAAVRPVVLVIDDLQWAEPLLLDLVEHLVQWSSGVPLLVVGAARPELRDARSSLATPGGVASDVVILTGLDAGAATRLAANVIGGAELPAALAGRVLATSEGNPLFVAELVRMLVLDGTLVRQGDRWITTVEVSKLDMPATIHVLLAARIERLRPEDRAVLERAAVIGRQFSRAAVAHLMPREAQDLDARLEALRRSELIESDTGWFLGEPALRFHHVLIRDAAYRRVLKETRAELHERLADWIVARVGEAIEHDETIGWHLEQAHQNLRELGPLDARGTSLGERAARHLGAAGRRALARDDLALAAGLLGRAIDRLDPEDSARADLALDWCEALLADGDVGPAAAAIEELARLATDSERLRAWRTCFAGQLAALTDPQSLRATADAVANAAEALAAAGDAAGEAKAHSVRAGALARLGEVGACETALDLALAAARRARDRRRANAVLAGAPVAALWGPSPVTRASGRCLDVVRVLRITQGAPAVEAVALRCQAVLETLRGRGEAARRMLASSRRMVEELGIAQQLLDSDVFAGMIELLEGDAEAAEQCLRAAYEGLRERGLGIDAARAAALLGRALLAQGRAAEAEALSHESEALAGDDLKAAIAWRGVRAEALALRGDPTTAIELARAAVAIASATDALLDHADARSALATALRAAGRSAEADAEATRAFELWEAKGATLLVERAPRTSGASNLVPAGRTLATRSATRRVRPNFASEQMRRLGAAVAARDACALPGLWTEDAVIFHHPTGLSYGRDGAVGSFRDAFEATTDLSAEYVALATLGASLALGRLRVSAAGVVSGGQSFGAIDNHQLSVMEANASNQAVHVEIFAEHQLGEAVARLYGRFAELQPEGHARDAAAATARALEVSLGLDLSTSYDEVFAPDHSFVDHRLLGFPAARGLDAVRAAQRSLREIADDLSVRVEEIFALRPDALILRSTLSGTHRDGGGRFERAFLQIRVFSSDGRIRHTEWFDVDRETEALARFDALTAPDTPVRRLRPNAAIAAAERVEAMVDARDMGALEDVFGSVAEVVEHPTGGSYDGRALVATWSALLRSEQAVVRQVAVATLGDSLALLRSSMSVASMPEGDLASFGPVQRDEIVLIEVGADGRQRRIELFATDHLLDAMLRLYERYAELQTEAPEHTRASNTARSTRGLLVGEPALVTTSPHHEFRDHRLMGLHGGHVRAIDLERWRHALSELAEDVSVRVDEISCLAPNAWLVRTALAGLDRRSGGRFEQVKLDLRCFDASGQMERSEWFDVGCEAEALARFDALTAAPTPARRVRPSAATAFIDRLAGVNARRDLAALSDLLADDLSVVHHPTLSEFGREGALSRFAALYRAEDLVLANDPIATLGDSLVLSRSSSSASALADDDVAPAGAYRLDTYDLRELDAHGRQRCVEIFASEHLADAIARLYARYAELLPEGPERTRAAATARSVVELPKNDGWPFAADVELFDHRTTGVGRVHGAEAVVQSFRPLFDLTTSSVTCFDDVLGLRPDALLVRWTHSGSDLSGGAFERHICQLWVFGADGLVTRWEQFDADREAEALARFDELTKSRAVPVRRVRANAATANALRVADALRARDPGAFGALLSEQVEWLHHPTGTVHDGAGLLAAWNGLLGSERIEYSVEPLATLGESLALCRRTIWSVGGGLAGDQPIPFGEAESENVALIEVDTLGRRERVEIFADDHLGDAIARLYERYAELLPAGAQRERAATTARTIAAGMHWGTTEAILSPEIEFVDHRPLGLGSARGIDAFMRGNRSQLDIAGEVEIRADDVLALRPNAYLVAWMTSGTLRDGGGRFERPYLMLRAFEPDGRLRHVEWFATDRAEQALARFDELTAPLAPVRRVPANAATAHAARMDAAVAARDLDAFLDLLADDAQAVHHQTGTLYAEREARRAYEIMLANESLVFSHEPLATLGDTLALCRGNLSIGVSQAEDLPFGASNMDSLVLMEVDASGRRRATEFFALDKLADAVCRLYERHAELLPDGPERTRVAATARSLAALLGPFDLARFATGIAPALDVADYRRIGLEPTHGAEAWLRGLDSLVEIADDIANRIDDVLALRSSVLLLRFVNSGTARVGGGSYERRFLYLGVFGPDGLLARLELFEPDREAEALARFDELTAEAPEPRFANAASRFFDAFARCWHARDWQGVVAVYAPTIRLIDRRSLMGMDLEGSEFIANLQVMFEMGVNRWHGELLATRGERLALFRLRVQGENGTTGPFELEYLGLVEVDAGGRGILSVLFDPDDRDAAYAELDARYHAGEAAAQPSVAAGMREFSRAFAARDWDALTARCAPAIAVHDHRRLGWETLYGAAAYVRALRALVELAPDTALRLDHVEMREQDYLVVTVWAGTRDGGAFEEPSLMVAELDSSGRIRRFDQYELERLAEARARYASIAPLASRDPLRIPPNAATRTMDRFGEAAAARDWDATASLLAPGFRFDDRRRGILDRGDRAKMLASVRIAADSGARAAGTTLATAGDRLALQRILFSISDGDAVMAEIETLQVVEIDAEGRLVATVTFDPDDRRAASAELVERYAASHVDESLRASRLAMARAIRDHDLDGVRAAMRPGFVYHDRRRVGAGRLEGEDYIAWLAALFEQSPDALIAPLYVVAGEPHGTLSVGHTFGTRVEGGAFESVFVQVAGPFGVELYDLEDLDAARARFEALRGDPA